MAFKSLSLSSRRRYITGISNFSGLDYSTQRFKVDPNHSIDMNNFIYKDGVIQKRQGFEELYSIKPTLYISLGTNEFKTNTTTFNGLWAITGEDKQMHVVAHIGRLLYEIKNIEDDEIEIALIGNGIQALRDGNIYSYAYEFEDYKSSLFVGANRGYFLGGNKFMCLRFLENEIKLYPIENHQETYIPTTTVSITYENSLIGNRSSLDHVNLLTQWRKNEMMSGTLKNEDSITQTDFFDYTLDSPLIYQQESDMKDFLILIEERGTIENG